MIKSGRICPVCGKHQFEKEGYYEGCPVCWWRDDDVQTRLPDFEGGANDLSLNQFRAEYEAKLKAA